LEHAVDAMQYSNNDCSNDHVKQQFTIMVAENCEVYISLFNIIRQSIYSPFSRILIIAYDVTIANKVLSKGVVEEAN
jgi:hypothetical protein